MAASEPGGRAESVIAACPSCGTRNRVPSVAKGTPRCASCKKPLPWLVAATDADFADVVERSSTPVLLDLWAPWCAPCRMVAPGVERAAAELAGRIKAVQVNVDEAPAVAARFDARSIPTLLVLRGGEVIARQVGALPAAALLRWVRTAVT